METILETLIKDCNAKGAALHGWEYSPNKRIVVKAKEKSIYYTNLKEAIYSLIHTYNLKKEYKDIFLFIHFSPNKNAANNNSVEVEIVLNETFEYKLLNLFKKTYPLMHRSFGNSQKEKIIQVFHQANDWNTLGYDRFYVGCTALKQYCDNMIHSISNRVDREYGRSVLGFLRKVTFNDFRIH
jgi:hypothetical protein